MRFSAVLLLMVLGGCSRTVTYVDHCNQMKLFTECLVGASSSNISLRNACEAYAINQSVVVDPRGVSTKCLGTI